MKLAGILILIAFFVGSCMGGSMKSTDVEFVKIRQPAETVTVEPEPLPAETIYPESCQRALRYAESMASDADKMFASGDKQLQIMSEVRIAITQGDSLVPLEERQRALRSNLMNNLEPLSRTLYSYEQALEQCEEETQ